MRRLILGAAVVPLLIAGLTGQASAQTNAALDEGAAATSCASYFGLPLPVPGDPLASCLWGMRAIHADALPVGMTGEGVKVGIIDGGVDMTHPDVVPNFSLALSCSFIFSTTPTADPQEVANGDCSNKAAVQDLEGHGTHVATTIAAPVNGIGIAGVAPKATIVALKACTEVGYCFADSVAAALRYAGDQRLDVVNLSLFADPYLYYCANAAGQRAILRELQSAAKYAQQRGVVIVAAAGNEAQDLGHPIFDDASPNWPPGSELERTIHNNCRVAPAELPGVITVSASGVRTLASYSSYGSPVDVTAPGGDAAQTPGTTYGRILAGWSSTDASGTWEGLSASGRAVTSGGGRYVWISGTSMASPHAAGVAALIRQAHPGMPPSAVAALLRSSATPLDCPALPAGCTGGKGQTSFFGSGMANAFAAVTR